MTILLVSDQPPINDSGSDQPIRASPLVDAFEPPPAADERQDMLSVELHHRLQNTLAIVLALARLTARSCKTIDEFQAAFGARVQAMARTNALLLRGNAQALDVRAVLEVELEPYTVPGGPMTLECEDLSIHPDSALSLSLLIHELATNAAKYGALSERGGKLIVECRRGDAGGELIWRETSPKQLSRAPVAGAGSVLIDKLVKDLGGEARLTYLPAGLEAVITCALEY